MSFAPTAGAATRSPSTDAMLTLLFGTPGTGKTTLLFEAIAADLAAGIPSFLVVPEQSTVSVEAQAATLLPPSFPLSFEVTNFPRLADTVFRRVGGVATRYADEATATLLARDAILSVLPHLRDARRPDAARIARTLATVRECKMAGITPAALSRAAEELRDMSVLSGKLDDLSLLLSAFDDILAREGCSLPADGLLHLADVLATGTPLAGAHFYFDGFTSFTAAQRAVMAGLLRAGDATVALSMPAPAEASHSLAYAETERTVRDLTRMASEGGIPLVHKTLTENRRTESPLLAALARVLFSTAGEALPDELPPAGEDLRIFECRTPFSEAEWVAADIARRVQAGARYRDFAIIARTAESYAGVLDSALARHGIPSYFSLPSDLCRFEAVKLIRTAYAILTDGARREDVITYLKCALSGIPTEDADRFELYAERWGLSGRALLFCPLTRSPSGYEPPRNEKERAARRDALAALNRTREALLAPLSLLEPICKGDFAIKEHATRLYEFLSALSLDKKLYERACEHAERGDAARADEYARLFGAITDVLDLLVSLLPESRLSAVEFSELLFLLFSEKSLRTIPQSADSVTVGSADLLRPGEPRHVYLIGVNAGVFPRAGEGGGHFAAEEIDLLAEHGIVLDGNALVYASREYYCFLRALASAGRSVTLSYSLTDFSLSPIARSEVLDRILRLLGNRTAILREADVPLADRIFSQDGALTALGVTGDAALAAAIREALGELPGGREALLRAARPLSDTEARVGREVMTAALSGRVALTQSRIDQYVGCPFSYFCRYVLRLSDEARISFNAAGVGTFIHAVLEYFFAEVGRDALPTMSDEEIDAAVRRLTDEYLASLFPEGDGVPPRLRHRFSRLASRTSALVRELRTEAARSSFLPLFFEYEPSERQDDAPPPAFTLDDGTRVTVYGKIDRVDVLRRGDTAYLRIIDYKTGTHTFSLDEVARGRKLQLLIYLFSLSETERPAFLRRLGIPEDGHILPAGALYYNVDLGTQQLSSLRDAAAPICRRTGLLLDEGDILLAMDKDGRGELFPVLLGEDGTATAKSGVTLAGLEKMGELEKELRLILSDIAVRLRDGIGDAVPTPEGQRSPCDRCPYFPICRHTDAEEGKRAE